MTDAPGWEEFEPKNGEEALGLALITAGVCDMDADGLVKMDRKLVEDILEEMGRHGFSVVPDKIVSDLAHEALENELDAVAFRAHRRRLAVMPDPDKG